jgi:large subunit ribosomal protein L15
MLNNLQPLKTKQKRKQIGRGIGSGVGGHTVGRGQKGQKSRSGYKAPRPGFEGGQMPLSRRLPKLKGFDRGYFKAKKGTVVLNLDDLNKLDLAIVSVKNLTEAGVLSKSKYQTVKILADGELTKKVEILGIAVSKTAREKIEKAGGKVTDSVKE